MKVCVYSKMWRSGTGWFIHLLAEHIAKSGTEVIFVSPLGMSAFEPTDKLVKRYRPPRELLERTTRLLRVRASLARVFFSFWYLLRARLETTVILISIPDPYVFFIPMLLLLKLTGASIIYVVHDAFPHAWRLAPPLRPLERFGYRTVYRLSNHLVTLSESAKAQLIAECRVPPDKITHIPHVPFELKARPATATTGRLTLFGTLRRNKSIVEAIEAVALVRKRGQNVVLRICGEPHSDDLDYWSECLALAKRHPEAVEIQAGYVPDEALGQLLSECDAFLMPYRDFNSQSGVVMLAAFNEKPVISSAAGGMREMFDAGLSGVPISPPITSASVASAIEQFYASEIRHWRDAAHTFKTSWAEQHGWPKITQSYNALFARFSGR